MTPDEAAKIVRSLEHRAIEHTVLLKLIAKAAVLTAACAVIVTVVSFFR